MQWLLAALPLLFPPADPQVVRRLEAREIVVELHRDEDGFPEGTSTGLLGAPLQRAWEVLTDFDAYSQYYTGIHRSEVRRRSGNQVLVHMVIDFPWPMPDRWVLLDFRLDEAGRRFTWTRLDGTVKRYRGALRLAPWPGNRTVMEFDGLIDPGFPFLPNWLMAYFTAQSLPGIVSGPRDYLDRTARSGM
ncbi:MAG: SRPBCC family protein [Candidatus Sericytochromatia bacterium]|nr:SRPBCC family protein [Candidatus Tanganyikabacteria bacterium]